MRLVTLEKSKYKGVYLGYKVSGKDRNLPWSAQLTSNGSKWHSKYFLTEREAAIAYDKRLIELGKPPVNILKAKV